MATGRVTLSELREFSVALDNLTRCLCKEEASQMPNSSNQTGPKIWLMVGAVIAVAVVVVLLVLYGGGSGSGGTGGTGGY